MLAAMLCVLAVRGFASEYGTQDRTVALTLVTLNLWNDKGDCPERQRQIVATLRELHPDVITLQEVIQHEGLPNQAESIARALDYRYAFSSVDPAGKPQRFGNAILTRHRILAQGWKKLAPLDDYRAIAHVRIAVGRRMVNVYTTHLHWTGAGSAIRAVQVADALDYIAATSEGVPSILAGDLNAAMDAPELRPLEASFLDAYASMHPGAKPDDRAHSTLNLNQYAAKHIDQVLLQRGAFVPTEAKVILDKADADGVWPSDHYGVLVRFQPVKTPGVAAGDDAH
jgi:endonuclease/exonuclease/phosphatase family metal-dependent hydrolase